MQDQTKPQIPCPRDNEGNIVNVSTCCGDDKAAQQQPQNLVFYEKEPPTKHCCFNVYIIRCWLTHNRDAIDPAGGIILMGYANEQSGVAPGLAGYLHIHPKHGWVNLNQKIGTFKVKEGEKFPVLIRVDALEWGEGLDGASDVGSDREPSDSGTQIILDCAATAIARTQLAVKLQRPGGGDAGRIVAEIAAFKETCCC